MPDLPPEVEQGVRDYVAVLNRTIPLDEPIDVELVLAELRTKIVDPVAAEAIEQSVAWGNLLGDIDEPPL